MTVCAYLAGREFAGSAATKEACARLGCITAKTFDRVHETVSNLIQKSTVSRAPRAPTAYSLGQKYGFTSDELQITLAVESMLRMDIPRELKDERIVCGLFAVICQLFGYNSSKWIKEEGEIYELDADEVITSIERMSVVHGEKIKTFVLSARNPGRSSRQSQPTRTKQPPLPKIKDLASPALKRKASDEEIQKQGPAKRAKRQATSTASTATVSTRHTASSESSRHSPPATELSTLDWMSTLENVDKPLDWKTSGTGSVESPDSSPSESEHDYVEHDLPSDWESLARVRRNVMAQRRMGTNRAISKPVFADKSFWKDTWT
ncbi:hypothetical protein M408DRAFT_330330 [Serendipita vermifera MAFF 305830]|uniref:Uncharacterized protein n=1 Tax=Serendipita vermifera MAFF 305830 TaxID=933852 RepID=A0A0C3AQZ3_SERVB|nr:hypothetical protein M408DRAFT_330330 [Serendipita vermifera MAFF 305830]